MISLNIKIIYMRNRLRILKNQLQQPKMNNEKMTTTSNTSVYIL